MADLATHTPHLLRCSIAVAALWLGGCTVVEIRRGADEVQIERHFGLTSIEMHPTTDAVVARTRTFGIGGTPFGYAVGYASATIAATSPECRLILWVEDEQQLVRLREVLGDAKDICALPAQ